jgi:hypothetical protein
MIQYWIFFQKEVGETGTVVEFVEHLLENPIPRQNNQLDYNKLKLDSSIMDEGVRVLLHVYIWHVKRCYIRKFCDVYSLSCDVYSISCDV